MQEIETILRPVKGTVRTLGIALPMHCLLAHHIPYSATLTTDELRRIIRLEASSHLPTFDPSDFLVSIYPLYGFSSTPFTALAVLIPHTVTNVVEHIASLSQANIQHCISTHAAAHNAFLHNYPEERGHIALCSIDSSCIDISIIRGTTLLHTSTAQLFPLSTASTPSCDNLLEEQRIAVIAKSCSNALQQATDEIQASLDSAYFFGAGLTKALLDTLSTTLPTAAKRYNPLRQLRSGLSASVQRSASRIAHMLVPNVGAILPEVFPGIILSSRVPQQRQVA